MQQTQEFPKIRRQNVERIRLHRANPLVPTALVLAAKNGITEVTADIDSGKSLPEFSLGFAIQGRHLPTRVTKVEMRAAGTSTNMRREVQPAKGLQSGITVKVQDYDSGNPACHDCPCWRAFAPPTSEFLPGREPLLIWLPC